MALVLARAGSVLTGNFARHHRPGPLVEDATTNRLLRLSILLPGPLLPFLRVRADDHPDIPGPISRPAGTFTFYVEIDWFGGTDRHLVKSPRRLA